MINTCCLVGNVGQDPEPVGTTGCRFTIAYNEKYKNKQDELVETTSWFTVKAWGKQAEFLMDKLKKGAKVLVQGSLRSNTVEAEDGTKRTYTDINADKVVLCTWPDAEGTPEEAHQAKPKAGTKAPKFNTKPASKLPF